MSEVQTEFLFEVTFDVPSSVYLGRTPLGKRYIADVTGGKFEGPELRGRALPGGGDWAVVRPDHVLQLDVRVTLETDDGALIYMSYRGLRHGSKEVTARLAAGEDVDPSEYYFRTSPCFETGSEKYGWLNNIVCVGLGRAVPDGVVYRVFKIL
ncbi:MAG: DUF3237 domain-containing protein [Alphaproteobacteria bacterium]|jgi:hypothetical protein|nr:DUF3237 domain-containing protein [Alphaproteobacteria bacterium]MDP6873051.1 DUF3237 domain-containing protein [Alphaproteobacteria bacterium]